MSLRMTANLTDDDIEYVHAYIDNAVQSFAGRWVGEDLGPLGDVAFDDYTGDDILATRDDVCLLIIRRLGKELGLLIENNNLGAHMSHRMKLLEGLKFYEDVHNEVLYDSHNVLCAVLGHVGDAVSDI